MIKQKADGSFAVKTKADLKEALSLMREKSDTIEEIETMMEEEYSLATLRRETVALDRAVKFYLIEKDENYDDDVSQFTIVKPKKWRWNAEKLKAIVGKALFMQLCDYTPNSDKIEEAVRSGKVDKDKIEAAYEADMVAAYVKHTVKSKATGDDEAERVKAAMNG